MRHGKTIWPGGPANGPWAPCGTTFGVIGVVVAVLVLAACGSDDHAAKPAGATGPAMSSSMTISVMPAGSSPINPTTPIVVKAQGGRLTNVTITNTNRGTKVTGQFSDDNATWTSSEVLGFGATYKVVADGQGADGKPARQNAMIKTINPAKQANSNMIPAPGSVPDVGVGQPIVFQFTYSVKNKSEVQDHLQITSSPRQDGGWYWIDDKNVHYRPKDYWKPGTSIHVMANLYGVDFGNGVYGAEDRDVTYKVHDSWVAKADGNTEQMAIYHNGQLVNTMPISMGKDSTPTHLGIHVISFKAENYTMDSSTYGVFPGNPAYYRSEEHFSERISNDGEFVHENPNSVSAQGNSNVSHGCINLNADNAQWFFQHFDIGDVVEVTNSGGKQLPVYDLYGDWSIPWSVWQKGNADS